MRVEHVNATVQVTTMVSPAANDPLQATKVAPADGEPQLASVGLLVPAGLPVPDSVGPDAIDIPARFIRPVSTIVGRLPADTGSMAVSVAVQVIVPSRLTVELPADFVMVVSGATTQVVTVAELLFTVFAALDRSGVPVTVPSANAEPPICASLL